MKPLETPGAAMPGYAEVYRRAMEVSTGSLASQAPPETRTLARVLSEQMQYAVLYQIQPEAAALLKATDNTPRPIRLPFPIMWLEMACHFQGYDYPGFLLTQGWPEYDAKDPRIVRYFFDRADPLAAQPGRPKEPVIAFSTIAGRPEEPKVRYRVLRRTYEAGPVHPLVIRAGELGPDADDERAFVSRLIVNLHDFLTTPEVEARVRARSASSHRRALRKYGVPASMFTGTVVLHGGLAEYVRRLRGHEIQAGPLVEGRPSWYRYAFEVAGHWRVLRHPRFARDPGTGEPRRVLIPPHVKGVGVLVRKPRVVTSTTPAVTDDDFSLEDP